MTDLTTSLKNELSPADMEIIDKVTTKSETTTFNNTKHRLKKKFNEIYNSKKRNIQKTTPTTIKPITLNLCSDEIPEHHKELLDLGPKWQNHQWQKWQNHQRTT